MRERLKIEVRIERREDGGLRVWSPDVPGFRLSHPDALAVMSDIIPALEGLLSENLGGKVRVYDLIPMAQRRSGLPAPEVPATREYVSELMTA